MIIKQQLVSYKYLRKYCPKYFNNPCHHAHILTIRYFYNWLISSTVPTFGGTSITADKIKIDHINLQKFCKDENILSETLCESVKCIYVNNLSLSNYPILEYLEYLKGQLTEASSVHLHTLSSKVFDLSKLTKLPAGLKLSRLSIGKLKSKRYSSKFEGKLVYVLWSYQNSHVFMQANCKVGISEDCTATVITPKYLAVRNFKYLDLKAITILSTSHFKCKELLQFYSEQFSSKYNNYGTMTIQNIGLVNVEKKFTINSFCVVKSHFCNIADSLDDIKEKQIKVCVSILTWKQEDLLCIDQVEEIVNQFNINSLKLTMFVNLLKNKVIRSLIYKTIENDEHAKAYLKIGTIWIKEINESKREFIKNCLESDNFIKSICGYNRDIYDIIEINE